MLTTLGLFDEENDTDCTNQAQNSVNCGLRAMSTQKQSLANLALNSKFLGFGALVCCPNHISKFLNLLHAAFSTLHIRRGQRVGFFDKYPYRA